jgi:hypothetical protein
VLFELMVIIGNTNYVVALPMQFCCPFWATQAQQKVVATPSWGALP